MNKKKLIIGGTAAGVILVAAIFGFVFLKGHSSGSSDSGDLVYVDSVTSLSLLNISEHTRQAEN